MKVKYLLIILALFFYNSCAKSIDGQTVVTKVNTNFPINTIISTSTKGLSQTATPPLSSFTPIVTKETITDTPSPQITSTSILVDFEKTLTPFVVTARPIELLEHPVCELPCFWNINPGNTKEEEVSKLLHYLDLPSSPRDNRKFTQHTTYIGGSADDLRTRINFFSKNATVQYLDVYSYSLYGKELWLFEKMWNSFEPTKILEKYGTPTKIWVYFSLYGDRPLYRLVFLYEKANFIIIFGGRPNSFNASRMYICPNFNQGVIDEISIYSQSTEVTSSIVDYPFFGGPIIQPDMIPINQAMGLSEVEFSELLMDKNTESCFYLIIQ
jgi:hypothetical protein